MASGQAGRVVEQLRRAVLQDGGELSDGGLLDRFLAQRDEEVGLLLEVDQLVGGQLAPRARTGALRGGRRAFRRGRDGGLGGRVRVRRLGHHPHRRHRHFVEAR